MAAQSAKDAVFVHSESFDGVKIQGPDFNMPLELHDLLNSYQSIGFQATGLARAIELINKMASLISVPSPSSCLNLLLTRATEHKKTTEELAIIG